MSSRRIRAETADSMAFDVSCPGFVATGQSPLLSVSVALLSDLGRSKIFACLVPALTANAEVMEAEHAQQYRGVSVLMTSVCLCRTY